MVILFKITFRQEISLKKDNRCMNGSECCNMSIQKEFSICLSEAFQTTQNLNPRHFKTPLLHSKNPQNKLRSSEIPLCAGDEFPFPLAKPSRSFQNLTETFQGKSAFIILLLSKSSKNDHIKVFQ